MKYSGYQKTVVIVMELGKKKKKKCLQKKNSTINRHKLRIIFKFISVTSIGMTNIKRITFFKKKSLKLAIN